MLSLIFAFNLLFITSFFLGPSIDFRLFFGCCSLLLISLYNNEQQNAGNYVSMATLMLWLSYESGGLEVFGDLISHFIALYLCIFCVAMSGKILYRFGESSKSTIKK